MALEIFALIVMLVIAAVAIWLIVIIGRLPGNIAREREHPQADAISILGWIGVITMGLGWFIAIVWAYSKPLASIENMNKLQHRITELEKRCDDSARETAQ
ncbi:MAG: DUF3302 domain-containing protein [Halioglobus sp.]